MKRQINPSIKAYFIRGAFCLLLLLPVCLIPFALGQLDTALNSTMSDNGVEIQNSNGSLVTIGNTIFKVSPGGHSIVNDSGTSTSRGYNISNDDGGGYLNGPGDQINTDPLLGPLQSNGGPTSTHALLPDSAAIDAGDPIFIPPPSTDQRGCPFDRVFNGRIDIGSFETQPPPRHPCPRPRPTPAPRP